MERIAREAVVHGRVQGVWFRASVQELARRRRVDGWAANQADGTVCVWMEGEPAAVEAVERFLHDGPPGAAVERVQARDVRPSGAQGFQTR